MRTVIILLAGVVGLSGCAAQPSEPSGVQVVASTNVYGDLVEAIGGDLVSVTSLIDGPDQDPHSFEASARDQLAVSNADVIVMNGGGYDPFMLDLISAAGADALVLDAVEQLGLGTNEHVWYSVDGVNELATTIGELLIAVDPDHVDEYVAGADAFAASLAPILDSFESPLTGNVLMTEPVPFYLLQALGLTDVSPPAFTEAIEEGGDVPPAALKEVLELTPDVSMLAYNSQTASPETERVRAAAEAAGVPVVDFTELLPQGQHYAEWMTENVAAVQAALRP